MPIDRIPILSADYPLFDWDDHLLSYYALGQGELVSGFQKETWNAIIDKAQAALSAAGMRWDSAYTSALAAKVTQAYGPLSAEMFNSVRYNIDQLTPIGWGWSKNPNMRGYIGRDDFKGYSKYGLSGDLFYAEYLLELVRRLNLTLSIMKGTANLSEMVSLAQSLSQSIHNLLSLPSAPMDFSEPSRSSFICGIRSIRSGSLQYKDISTTEDIASLLGLRVKRMIGTDIAQSLHTGKQAAPFVKNLGTYQYLTHSLSQAAMEIFNCIYLSSAYGLSKSKSQSKLILPRPHLLQSQESALTTASAVAVATKPQPMQSSETSKTKSLSTAIAPTGIKARGETLSKGKFLTVFETIRPRRISVKTKAQTTHIAYLSSAWFAPIWVGNRLYIRQAYEANMTATGLEVK